MHKTVKRHYDHFHKLSKRRIHKPERADIKLKLEKLNIKRERSKVLMNRGLAIYFCLMVAAVVGFVNGFFSNDLLNIIALTAVFLLVLSAIPFIISMYNDEKEIDEIIKDLASKK